jgi:hypothetical protein
VAVGVAVELVPVELVPVGLVGGTTVSFTII